MTDRLSETGGSDSQRVNLGELKLGDGDLAVLLRREGPSMVAFVRHGDEVLRMPGKVEVHYAPEGGLKPIRAVLRVGWTNKQWESMEDA